MNIIYCIGNLASPGGAERVLVNKANYLAALGDYHVTILIANQDKKNYAYKIDDGINVMDMMINESQHFIYSIPLIGFFYKIGILKKKYQKVINQINPDIVINVERGFEDFILPSLEPKRISIRESHSSLQAVNLMSSSGSSSLKKNFFTKLYNRQLTKFDKVVLLTEEDRIYRNYKNGDTVIPNLISAFDSDPNYDVNSKKVISVGRLDVFKNFKDQIEVWKEVVKKFPSWTLHIYGEGPEKPALEKLIHNYHLKNNVFLEGRTNEVEKVLKSGSFFLFTSKAEGFGMVLVEAMQMGLPVVSYDCPCGPKDIISDGNDGFLVPLNDKRILESKITSLITDDHLRTKMSEQAIKKSKMFSEKIIMPQWIELFNQLKNA